jgi:uncharacterized protein YlzI (FlbEa/FlbD family)
MENKKMEIFTCSCMTLNCNCREKFNTTTSTNTSMTTITTESFINGEKVTKENSVEVIFNKIKSRQRRENVKNAMKEKKKLKGRLN